MICNDLYLFVKSSLQLESKTISCLPWLCVKSNETSFADSEPHDEHVAQISYFFQDKNLDSKIQGEKRDKRNKQRHKSGVCLCHATPLTEHENNKLLSRLICSLASLRCIACKHTWVFHAFRELLPHERNV